MMEGPRGWLETLIVPRTHDIGGFEVRRALPSAQRRMVGPFIFWDQMGPAELKPGHGLDVRPHPHIGLATVTYLFDGEIMHRDSVGSEQPIRPGELNWMTAGRGITHSERFEKGRREGGHMNGIQAWVALPERDEETDPSFHHYGAAALPTFQEGGGWGRLIAGASMGLVAPAQTHSPLFYVHWVLEPGAAASVPAEHPERALYVAQGVVEVAGQRFEEGHMIVLTPGDAVTFRAETKAIVMASRIHQKLRRKWSISICAVCSSPPGSGRAYSRIRPGRNRNTPATANSKEALARSIRAVSLHTALQDKAMQSGSRWFFAPDA